MLIRANQLLCYLAGIAALHAPEAISPVEKMHQPLLFFFFFSSAAFTFMWPCFSVHLLQGGETLTNVDTLCLQACPIQCRRVSSPLLTSKRPPMLFIRVSGSAPPYELMHYKSIMFCYGTNLSNLFFFSLQHSLKS